MATARPADSATATVPARSDRHAPLLEIRDLKTWFHTDRDTGERCRLLRRVADLALWQCHETKSAA